MHYTTSVSDEFNKNVCSGCWNVFPTNLAMQCEDCHQVAYCSNECKQRAEHFLIECHGLKYLHSRDNTFTPDQNSEIRMILKMLAKAAIEKAENNTPQHQHTVENFDANDATAKYIRQPLYEDLLRLVPNASNYPAQVQEDVTKMAAHVRKICPKNSLSDLTDADIENLFYREKCNCFGMWDESDRCLASAIFPIASFFNHSCVPNCTRYPDVNGCIAIRTLYPVPAGTELTIAYTTIKDITTTERKEQLSSYYCFDCGCDRCKDPTTRADEFVTQYLCKRDGCSGVVVPPEGEKSTTRKCRACPYEEPLDYASFFADFRYPQ